MISALLAVAVVAAVVSVAVRRWSRLRAERNRPGATLLRAVFVNRFDEIDRALEGRTCWCGGTLARAGETSRAVGERRFRIARLVCAQCERDELMYFDVTTIFH